MPIYIVKTKATRAASLKPPAADALEVEQTRLVRAKVKAQAVNFAADKHISVEQASEDDLIKLTKQGIEVEEVGE